MRSQRVASVLAGFAFGICSLAPAIAQNHASSRMQSDVVPEVSPRVPDRVLQHVDDTRLVRLPGNTHFLAQPRFDRGTVDPQLPLERMQLVLRRSPEQEHALELFMNEQLDPKSPNFHHWLHAEEFGRLYGPSDSDLSAITSWLQNHGFQIDLVTKGRINIEFSGTARQVQEAFHTELHNYLVNGRAHIANNGDPQIPEALSPVVLGIASLHNFFPQHQSILGRYVTMNRTTGKSTPIESGAVNTHGKSGDGVNPNYVFADPNLNGVANEDIGPYDFAAIYNLTPLWNAGITGKGLAIAIASQTDITVKDVTTFRSFFGLSKFAGTVKQVINGPDPGIIQDNVVENTLDTEWAGATAPDAQIIVVSSKGTATTTAGVLSISYIVDNETAPIMSASYGECEAGLGGTGNANLNTIFQQGSAEGISLFESAGDQGSTGCDNSDATTFPAPAQHGLQVNGFASSPYITGVGGTDFVWQTSPYSKFWNYPNDANNATAIGYIPEIPWNSTCTSTYLLTSIYTGQTSSEELCNNAATNQPDLVSVVGGSGGRSACLSNQGTFSSCTGAYAKPSWQTGIGVPNDNVRDVPDLSLFASGGQRGGNGGSAYLICVSSNSPDKSCDYTGNDITAQEVGGTSVSSPAMAGIMALVVQKMGAAQGLANPSLYKLAAKDNRGNCNSTTVASGNTCTFYDVTSGTNAMVCITGTIDCLINTSGDQYGIVSASTTAENGYNTTTGYDLATGLGSVNATNLVNNWASVSGTTAVTVSPTTFAFPATVVNTTSGTSGTITVKNTGTAAVSFSTVAVSGTNASSFSGTTTCPLGSSLAAGATCTVTVSFRPTSTGGLSATISITDGAGTQTVSVTGTGTTAANPIATLSPTSLTFASTTVGVTTSAQAVTLKNTGTAALTLTSETLTGTNASSFLISANTCSSSLAAAASCTISVEFKPTVTGSLTASLSIADNATGSPQTVALSGTGAAATTGGALTITPASIAFPSTTVGSQSAAQQVVVKNTGTTTVTFTGFTYTGTNASSFVQTAINCGSTLASGSACAVLVAFKPTIAGALTGTLNIADNATGAPQKIALSGTGTTSGGGSTLSITPASIAFPSTAVGSQSAAQQVVVKNTGATTVTFTGFTYTGTNASSFVQTAINCGSTLASGSACAVLVAFKPTTAAALTGTLNIADNATGSPQKISLTGTGTTTGGSGTITLTPTSVAFPNTIVGSTSDAQIVTLKNTGTTTVTITSMTLGGTNPTSFQELTSCGSSIAASASCSLYVAFKPVSSAALTATLSLADSATGSPQTITLSGTGTAAPSVKLSATSLAFGTVTHGTTSPAQALTLTNSGTATLTLTSIGLSGTNASAFQALDTCGATLAPAASCTVYIAFKPVATGTMTASLVLADNGAASPQSVALTGTGN